MTGSRKYFLFCQNKKMQKNHPTFRQRARHCSGFSSKKVIWVNFWPDPPVTKVISTYLRYSFSGLDPPVTVTQVFFSLGSLESGK